MLLTNTSSGTCTDPATTSKSNPINIVELCSNHNFNHPDDRPFLDCTSTLQYEYGSNQIIKTGIKQSHRISIVPAVSADRIR